MLVRGKFPLKHQTDVEGSTLMNKEAWAKIFNAVQAEASEWADQDELESIIEDLRIGQEAVSGTEST